MVEQAVSGLWGLELACLKTHEEQFGLVTAWHDLWPEVLTHPLSAGHACPQQYALRQQQRLLLHGRRCCLPFRHLTATAPGEGQHATTAALPRTFPGGRGWGRGITALEEACRESLYSGVCLHRHHLIPCPGPSAWGLLLPPPPRSGDSPTLHPLLPWGSTPGGEPESPPCSLPWLASLEHACCPSIPHPKKEAEAEMDAPHSGHMPGVITPTPHPCTPLHKITMKTIKNYKT